MSLRARLLLAVAAATLLALLAADVVTYSALRSFLYQRVDESLVQSRPLGGEPDRGGPGDQGRPGPHRVDPIAGRGAVVALRSGSGVVTVIQAARDVTGAIVELNLEGIRVDAHHPTFETVSSSPGGTKYRVRSVATPEGGAQLVALPLDDAQATLSRLLGLEAVVTVGALAAAAAFGWWLVRLGLRPLLEVEATAEAIAAGQLDRRVRGDQAQTEVGRLARVLNTMLGRIEAAFAARDTTEAELRRSEERMRQFVADASHELRTPLSAVSAYAELYERGAKDHPEDLERLLRGIRTESGRMAELVEDLLLLARLDEGRPLRQEKVDLGALAPNAVAAAGAVGPAWPIDLVIDSPVEVVGDPGRFRQVFDNLLANVRAHTPAGISVTVQVTVVASRAVVRVADNGPGMTAEVADRVFERFFRADASRARAQAAGGNGLGLSIVAAIVAAHGGTVTVETAPARGTTFEVSLPLEDPQVAAR
ncbi:MAG: sensor histidine kinase [Acidimicrobiales bacterium]